MMAERGLPDAVVCDEDWQKLVTAADAAGRQAALWLVRRASEWELGRTGYVHVDVGPPESPLAGWLDRTGLGERTQVDEVRIEITLADLNLEPESSPGLKAHSLLVRWVYANAFATVLVDEAGAVATPSRISDHPVRLPLPRGEESTSSQDLEYAAEFPVLAELPETVGNTG